ncbi:MAG: MDR/zinc-dependent alcohol dehydrogenase-like family protein [Anaerolineae bacterium]
MRHARACAIRFAFDPHYPDPAPAPSEAIIRVTRAGVCNTDVELLKGYMGFRGILGHEFVGTVESVMPVDTDPPTAIRPGDRVVGEINAVGPASPSRHWHERAQDPARTTLGIDRRDGAFADYTRLPLVNLHRVPDTVSDDEAVFVEPLAAACQVLEQVHIKPGDRVAVLGDGKLGLLCAQVLATTACDLMAIGKHAVKLDILKQRGITTMLVSEAGIDGARRFDVVIECTGAPAGFELARQLLRPRGTLALKSTYQGLPQANLTMIVVDAITVVGSRCGPFAPALRLLAQKRVDVTSLIHARYPLQDGLRALEHAQQPGVLKMLLDIVP